MNAMNESGKGEFEVRPRYVCCHPNPKGTGVSAKFELHPAHEYVEGSIFVTFASQKTLSAYGESGKIPPTFDWKNSVTVRLTINEIAEMLEVFRGYREKMGSEGKGLFHSSECGNTVITLEHRLEPGPGYLFGVSRKARDGEFRRMHILLSMKETIVLSEALSSSMLYMAFGIPKIMSRPERKSVKDSATDRRSKEVA
jgi:hypothetical protein